MKITANIPYEIEISEDEQRRIALNYLYKIFNWKSTYSINDEKVYDAVTKHHHSTNWIDSEYVRDATDDDYTVALILDKMK